MRATSLLMASPARFDPFLHASKAFNGRTRARSSERSSKEDLCGSLRGQLVPLSLSRDGDPANSAFSSSEEGAAPQLENPGSLLEQMNIPAQ